MAVKKAELVRFLYKLDWPTETRNVQEVEYAFDDQVSSAVEDLNLNKSDNPPTPSCVFTGPYTS